MKKVLNGIRSFHALGFKKQCVAIAICAGLGMTTLSITYAASPNINPPTIKANAPNVYMVKKGDTLWDISGKFLDKPWRWPEIWASNQHVKNPHWIYPGDHLLLCTLDGHPLVGRDEGDGCQGIIRRYAGQTTLQPQVRIEQLNHSIPVIPLDNIKQWLNRTAIVASDSIENTPYILGTADQRILASKGQSVYIRGHGLNTGQRYAVYHKGEPYTLTDKKGKKYTAGLELLQVASGIVSQTDQDIATMELTDSYNTEVRRGDLVMIEQEAMLPTLFYPTDTDQLTQGGHVIRVMGSIGSAAKNSVVTIDHGHQDGVQSGHVFAIYQQGETVQDPKTKERIKLPNQKVGTLMVFRTFDQLSYAYVLESSLPIKVGAELQPPRLDD